MVRGNPSRLAAPPCPPISQLACERFTCLEVAGSNPPDPTQTNELRVAVWMALGKILLDLTEYIKHTWVDAEEEAEQRG